MKNNVKAKPVIVRDKLPQWDLSDFYSSPNSAEFKFELKKLEDLAVKFAKKYSGRVEKLSGDNLALAIYEYEKIVTLSQKLGSYAYLVFSTEMLDEKIGAFYQNTSDKINDAYSHLLFFTLGINKIPEKKLEKKFKSEKLAEYWPWIRDLRVGRKYQLPDELEKFDLDKSSASTSPWVRLFDETHASLKYDFRGQKLSNAEIFDKLSNRDPKIRKDAAVVISKTLSENIRTFTLVTNVLAKDKAVEQKWRGYKAPISSRNLSNLVEDKVVDALLDTVKRNYPRLSHRYYKWKAKTLNMKKMEFWDRGAPLPDAHDEYIPYKKAQEIVLNAYAEFSPQIAGIGKRFFDNAWIDAEPRHGKESGAYSHPGVVTLHPYILMNYLGKTRDVMTLAHELGHGVHQYLSRGQGTLMSDTPLTLAETASVFGEQLTFRSMLKNEKDARKKKAMIASKVEDMLNTVVRQVAFCEFEKQVHDARKNGELSSDDIGKIWMKAQKDSLGPIFNFSEDYKYYWSYIPHFIHSPFYVYAYAFGDCLVNSLYAVYLEKPQGFQEKYIQMLKAGGTMRHKELLKPFGLDASHPDFWQKGLDIIDDFITELES